MMFTRPSGCKANTASDILKSRRSRDEGKYMESFETMKTLPGTLLCLACSSRSDSAVIPVGIVGNLSAFVRQPGQIDGD